MVFFRTKRGNVAILVLLCFVILTISVYMIQNVLQLRIELKVLKEGYQTEMIDYSIYQVCADSILEILDERTFYLNERVLTNSDLTHIQNKIFNILNKHADFTINSPTADSLSKITCEINGFNIEITNIDKTYTYFYYVPEENQEEGIEEIDEDLSTVTLDADTAIITITGG